MRRFPAAAAVTIPILAAATLVLAACASSGSDRVADRRQSEVLIEDQEGGFTPTITLYNESSNLAFLVQHPPEQVWPALQEVWAALELTASEFDPQRKLIGSDRFRANRIAGERMATWVDCGQGMTGPNANRFDIALTLYTHLQPHEQGTELVVEMDGLGRPRDHSGNWVHCDSTGRLEALFAELVSARL